jgi:hypothetical protein
LHFFFGCGEAAVCEQLAEGRVNGILLVEYVAVLVVAVLEVAGGGTGCGVVPVLLDDAAEAVQAGVLVACVASLAVLVYVGQVDVVLRVVPFDDCDKAQVFVAFQDAAGVRQGSQSADAAV